MVNNRWVDGLHASYSTLQSSAVQLMRHTEAPIPSTPLRVGVRLAECEVLRGEYVMIVDDRGNLSHVCLMIC